MEHWEKLKASVLATDLILDRLIFKDVHQTAINDDQYFVFEDVLYQVLFCFGRDTEIAQIIQSESNISSGCKNKQYEAPPSGIVPFHGFSMFGMQAH